MSDTKLRFGGSKVRSGCITCKTRHVKCDEAKPHCTRCLNGGRKCDGYATLPTRRSSDQLTIINYVSPMSRSVSTYPQANHREVRALQYFQTRTASELAGCFSSELWDTFILRLAYHQSSVHHAVVALGTAHEHFTNGGLSDLSDYTNREYGRAMCEVVDLHVSSSPDAVEIALATCVLFACLENLRGHFKSSLSHLMSGLNVLEEEQRMARPQRAVCIPRETLLSLFLRMDAQRLDLGGSSTTPGTMLSMIASPAMPSCFPSVEGARHQLELLYHHILQLFSRAEEADFDRRRPRPPDFWHNLLEQKRALECMRQSWEDAFDTMLGREAGNESPASQDREPGVIVLDMANRTIKVLLHVDLVDPELDFDKYDDQFYVIVCDADEHIRKTSATKPPGGKRSSAIFSRNGSPQPRAALNSNRPTSRDPRPKMLLPKPEAVFVPIFSLSLGCVPALYLSASRCRNPHIRYRALDLLQKCNRREGLWDSDIAARIAANVIAIEEAKAVESFNGTGPSSSANIVHTPDGSEAVIPVSNRVKFVDLKFGPEAHGKAMYSFENPTRTTTSSGGMPSALDTTGLEQLYEW